MMRVWMTLLGMVLGCTGFAQDAVKLEELTLSVRLAEHEGELAFGAAASVAVADGQQSEAYGPGEYRLRRVNGSPTLTQYRVFGKSFAPGEELLAQDYLRLWRDKGYDTELVTLGRQYMAPSGALVDTRVYWVSFGREATETKAEALRTRLEGESVWAWVRVERLQDGRGLVELIDARGDAVSRWNLPVTLESVAPLVLHQINTGYWKEKRVDQAYAGNILIRVDDSGKLEVLERVALDDYLQGVLPAEMPSSWPLEALKAQAVAARSEVIFNAAKTHHLEGFDFCALEHCRAYGAESLRSEHSDAAVASTRGEVITHDGIVVPTVFSANCGGWSEDNDVVWSGPPQAALRAGYDGDRGARGAPTSLAAVGIGAWLQAPPDAWCRTDSDYFRWERTLTASELTQSVNKQHAVGRVMNISLGERGPGGRLKWVTITGRDGSATIRKELPIRLAFGGLPSAMFEVEFARSPEGLRSVTFRGGGRGHGVGLCQQGARGMALAGKSYADILRHYFSGVRIERVSER